MGNLPALPDEFFARRVDDADGDGDDDGDISEELFPTMTGDAMFQPIEQEFDNACLGEVDRMDEERRACVKETMADITRPRTELSRTRSPSIRMRRSSPPSRSASSAGRRAKFERLCLRWHPLRSWMARDCRQRMIA